MPDVNDANAAVPAGAGAPRLGGRLLVTLALALAAILVAYAPSLQPVWDAWLDSEEYSHGILMPAVIAYLLWTRRNALQALPVRGHLSGLLAVGGALLIATAGVLGSTQALTQYGCLLAAIALVYTALGTAWLSALRFPFLLLAIAIPLPAFFYNALSLRLQLWSSDLGVAFIRGLGISVFQDGNVIDLGSLQLEVAEACNGLRYLFPMLALAIIMAYIYQAPAWKRVVLVAASLAVAVLMNGLRIGLIGYLVEYHGPAIAEGFLHDVQGWMMFMASFAILLALVWLLERTRQTPRRLSEALNVDATASVPDHVDAAEAVPERLPASLLPATAAAVVLVATAVVATALPERVEVMPARAPLLQFPLAFTQWRGESRSIEATYLRALKLDDYLMADYVRTAPPEAHAEPVVNVYVAWYDSQRQGQAAHSPRSCLPGDGWEIESLTTVQAGTNLAANRALIRKGDDAQLVYYWFAQRGRIVTSEYAVKWWLLVDAALRNRTDGALVRLTTPLGSGEAPAAADARLRAFAADALVRLRPHLPE